VYLPYGCLPGIGLGCGMESPWPALFVSDGNSDRSSSGGVLVSPLPTPKTVWKLLIDPCDP